MNNTFNLNRFGKVLAKDASNFIPKFGWFLVVLWTIPILMWIFTFLNIDGSTINPMSRFFLTISLCRVSCILVPARLYRHINDPKKGMEFAMTPASSLEKLLSMMIFCMLVTPLTYFVGAYIIDIILSIIPNTPYREYLWNWNLDNFVNSITGSSNEALNSALKNTTSGYPTTLYKLSDYIENASIFMLGNAIFKKRKTTKTIGIIVLLIFTATTIMSIKGELINDYLENIGDSLDYMTDDEMASWLEATIRFAINIYIAFKLSVSAICLFFTYRKIKTQRY